MSRSFGIVELKLRETLSALHEQAGLPEIDDLLVKCLGVDRFGHSPPSIDEAE